MTTHIVVGGNGPVGREIRRILEARGEAVVSVSRTTGLAFDASDADALTRAARGAAAIYLAAMPRYDRWPTDFPPLMKAVVTAAEATGATIVSIGNLYPYGEGAPLTLTEDLPSRPTTVKGRVRAEMWELARASTAPAVEVRGSDYLGPGAVSLFTLLVEGAVRRGEPARIPMELDVRRPWTFVGDVAATAVAAAAVAAAREASRVFHVPSTHASVRVIAEHLAASVGAPPPRLERMTARELAALGEADPIAREVLEMTYLLDRPYVLDATDAEALLGVRPTPLDTVFPVAARA